MAQQKIKTFRRGFFGGRNAVTRKAERYARKHGYIITSLQLNYSRSRATAVFIK